MINNNNHFTQLKDMNCNGRALAVRCQGLSPTESGVSLKGTC